jgi:2,3-bisphosphoglycerate-dependent phosphoglycerate mutase
LTQATPNSASIVNPCDDIWLIRHGQSEANAGLATNHPKSIELTELGREQAQALVARVAARPAWVVVSPYDRTLATARPLLAHHAGVSVDTWPVQEFTYLSPARCAGTTVHDRQDWAAAYWQASDPHRRDANDSETFAELMQRLADFHARLRSSYGFGLVIGHGLFFKAYLIALEHGFAATPEAMQRFRRLESATPLRNAEPVVLVRSSLDAIAAAPLQTSTRFEEAH